MEGKVSEKIMADENQLAFLSSQIDAINRIRDYINQLPTKISGEIDYRSHLKPDELKLFKELEVEKERLNNEYRRLKWEIGFLKKHGMAEPEKTRIVMEYAMGVMESIRRGNLPPIEPVKIL